MKHSLVSRPVRVPDDTEARLSLAKDLSSGSWEKANCILHLPLFEVALDGHVGVRIAEKMARLRSRKAA